VVIDDLTVLKVILGFSVGNFMVQVEVGSMKKSIWGRRSEDYQKSYYRWKRDWWKNHIVIGSGIDEKSPCKQKWYLL